MHRSWGWKHQHYGWRPHHYRGWSPWMGIGLFILLFLVFSKGLFWPLLFIFFGVMLLKGGRQGWQWMGCEDETSEEKAKRKNDDYVIIDDKQPKRKNSHGDEETEPVYYL